MGCGCNKRAARAASNSDGGGGSVFLRALGFTTAGIGEAMDELNDARLLVKSRIVRRTGKVKGEYLPGDVTTGSRITGMGLSVRGLMSTGSLVLAGADAGGPMDPRAIGGNSGLSGEVVKKLARAGYGPSDYARLTNDHLAAVFALDSALIRAFRGVYPNPATGMLAPGGKATDAPGAPVEAVGATDAVGAADTSADAADGADGATDAATGTEADVPADSGDGLRPARGRGRVTNG